MVPFDWKDAIGRRDFVKLIGGTSFCFVAGKAQANNVGSIAILVDRSDQRICCEPIGWAVSELQTAIQQKGASATVSGSPASVVNADLCIAIASEGSWDTGDSGGPCAEGHEGFALRSGKLAGKPAVLVSGTDQRGLVYGILEVAERVRFARHSSAALQLSKDERQQPANRVRSVARAFVSEVEDKEWFYDRAFWRKYLAELAFSRYNRFSITFGIGYNFPRHVVDDYFQFVYPYLLDVPGYKVRVVPLGNVERDKNLDTLKFITDETARHGLECQIGIWTHAYKWVDSPAAHHQVQGLTAETHAPYCRDAMALLLKECPAIQGVTLRVHGESGIPEGDYSFWRTLFEGITKSGRKIEIDMHAKGMTPEMIKVATDTGMPVKISPKFWAEHKGLPYQQADIRALEVPHPRPHANNKLFEFSEGSRSFMRYGYGDLLKRDRPYEVLFRIWPGTQRMLLWGDPKFASAYGRSSHFCGAAGVEIFEPLFFKGRQGSGLPGGRCAYLDKSLKPRDGDFSKFRYSYRVWGHNIYNPDSKPDLWRRYLQASLGEAAPDIERAFSNCSRILPLLTTAHLPSASNNSFWPEIDTNMPIVQGSEVEPYRDTPLPRRFGTVSPLDPQLFASIEQYAKRLLDGQPDAKYSPIEVAHWLEALSNASNGSLSSARQKIGQFAGPEFSRFDVDGRIQVGLGRYFGAKLRSGVLYEIYLNTGDLAARTQAIALYKKARAAWFHMAERAKRPYRSDITYGSHLVMGGHWADRVAAIDTDIAAMESSEARTASTTYDEGS
ncbi:MAG: hypothetical protein ACREBW_04845, partial [Candidatus Micrarchaeaceae archaeon]